ncbi:MAG TPA: hypothetical protein VIK96_01645 [Bacilli bacterium]
MKKYLLGLIVYVLFALFAFPKTYAYWAQALPSGSVYKSSLQIGSWRKFIVLEEVGKIENPKAGDEFVFQNQFYVVLWDLDEAIPNNKNWWGWKNPWSGVNQVSELWLSTNYYDEHSLPVIKDGTAYLAMDSGASNQVPGTHSSWFVISDWYRNDNIYLKGYITKYGFNSEGEPRYWLAKAYVNPGYTPGNYNWAWEEILEWQGSVKKGATVYHYDSAGNVHFWQALKKSSVEPNAETARSGYFSEIINGWISPEKREIVNLWVEHNNYTKGEIVAFGSDSCLRYRYFQARKQSVGEAPYYTLNGKEVINSEYWTEIRKAI